VTDNRAAFGDFSGEHLTIKTAALWHGWAVMFAGNDVEHAEPIIRSAKKGLRALAEKTGRIICPEEAVEIVDHAYSEQLQAQIENKILRKRGYDTESFKQRGKAKCTPDVYARVWDQIGKEKLSLRFLVSGHDENGNGHIWLVNGEDAPTSYNAIHFWAIGLGAPAALSRIALYLSRFKEFTSLEEAIYVAVTAKFAGEAASNVGRSTFVEIEKHWTHVNDAIPLGEDVIEAMRASWESGGVPPVPELTLKGLKVYMRMREKVIAKQMKSFRKAKQSVSQTSVPEQ
jgi:hypothetical protein